MTRPDELRQRMHDLFEQYVDAERELSALEDDRFRVCIFGSARIKPDDSTYRMVKKLAKTLAKLGIDIVTGGGPGLMEAANLGEREAHAEGVLSIGLPIVLPKRPEASNTHLDIKSEHSRFSTRLDEFMRLSHAVIVAPGGIGTLLELTYVWQLVQVQLISPRVVVLLGKEFWSGLLDWMYARQARRAFINVEDLDFVHLADTPADVLHLIQPELEKFRARKQEAGETEKAAAAGAILSQVDEAKREPRHHHPLPGAETCPPSENGHPSENGPGGLG